MGFKTKGPSFFNKEIKRRLQPPLSNRREKQNKIHKAVEYFNQGIGKHFYNIILRLDDALEGASRALDKESQEAYGLDVNYKARLLYNKIFMHIKYY